MSARKSPEAEVPVAPADPLPSAQAVAAYLRQNPEFFVDHPDLAQVLKVPQPDRGAGVIDLQTWRCEALARELDALRDQHQGVLDILRENEKTLERVKTAILNLLEATSFEQLIDRLTGDMPRHLGLEAVVLAIETDGAGPPQFKRQGLQMLAPGTVEQLMGPVAARLVGEAERPEGLFGPIDPLIGSMAMVRLDISPSTPPALLVFGCRAVDGFSPDMRTDHLTFLAATAGRAIRAWLTTTDP